MKLSGYIVVYTSRTTTKERLGAAMRSPCASAEDAILWFRHMYPTCLPKSIIRVRELDDGEIGHALYEVEGWVEGNSWDYEENS